MYGRYVLGNNILVSLKPVNIASEQVVKNLTVTFEIYDEDRVLIVSEKTTVWNQDSETYNYIFIPQNDWPTQSLGTYFIAWKIEDINLTPTIMYRIKILNSIGIKDEVTIIGGGYTSSHISKKKKPTVILRKIKDKNIKPEIIVNSIEIKEIKI